MEQVIWKWKTKERHGFSEGKVWGGCWAWMVLTLLKRVVREQRMKFWLRLTSPDGNDESRTTYGCNCPGTSGI